MRHALAALSALVLSTLPLSSASASSPDLCDDVYLDATGSPYEDSVGMQLARFCAWTHEDSVSTWSDDVCCTIGTAASCTPTDVNGRCLVGAKFWCDYAVLDSGVVTCQQPWPDACAAGFCEVAPPGSTPSASEHLCCPEQDVCTIVDPADLGSCWGKYVACKAPFTNTDGSIGCADDE